MTFGKCDIGNIDAGFMFDKSFGLMGVQEDQIYSDPLRGLDLKKEMSKNLIAKAPSMNTTSGGTYTGYGLMPPFLDPAVVDRTVRQTPLVKLLPRRAVRGRSYVYNIMSAKGGAAFLSDDAVLSEQIDTRSTATVNMKYLYAVGRITGPAMASAEGFMNLMAEDIRVKTASMNEALEDEIINGNTSTNAFGFNGLIQLITTNTTDNSDTNVTLAQIREDYNTSFEANGTIDLSITDGYTHNYIKGLLMDFQRSIDKPGPDMQFGIPDSFMFDGVLFLRDRYMPTSAAARRIIHLDTRYVFLAVLRDYTFARLAETNDSGKYYIKWYGTLVNSFEEACVMRYGLA